MPSAKRIIEWVVKIGLLIVPVLPLVVTRSLFFPFITGKNFIFRIIIEILLIGWVWLMLTDKAYRPRSSWILYGVLATVLFLTLSTIFGISPYKSFWSSYERMEGLWAFWHYLLYFLMLISVFKQSRDWLRFFSVSLAASVVMSFYALLQLVGKLAVHQGDVRLDGTMGNATYLAIYLIFHIFLFGYFFFQSNNKWLRAVFVALALFEFFIVYYTATRGALLGLLAGVLLFSLVAAVWSRGLNRKIAIAFLVMAVLIPIVFLLAKDSGFVQSSQVLSRFASISFTETTTQSRFIVWNMAYQAFKERPILGWGPESFVYIFSKYYDSRMWRQEPWFDRAHNVFFDWLTAGGIVGLGAYLSIFGSAVFVLYKLFRNKSIGAATLGIFLAMLLAYFIHNIFVFDNFTSYMIFFAIVGYLHWQYVQLRPIVNAPPPSQIHDVAASKIYRPGVLGIVFVLVAFSVYTFNVKPILASKSIIGALGALTYSKDGSRERSLEKGLVVLQKGIARNTFGTTEIREQTAQYAERIVRDPATPQEDKIKFLTFALEEIKKQAERFPYDVRAKAFLSTLYGTAGNYPQAILTAQEGLAVSSQRQQFYFLLAEAYFKAGEENLAMETLRQAYELAPEYPEAVHNYAMTAIFAGQPEVAESLLKKHFGVEIFPDARYVNAYAAIGDFKKLTQVWEKLVEQSPDNAQYRLSLASAYVKTFQDAKAIKELEKAIELTPSFKAQGEIFIRQIKEGQLQR